MSLISPLTRCLALWKRLVRQLKIDTYALYLAYQDSRTPWYAKLVAAGVVAYAFSPIDLIPDFIPILGYLDDLILLPLGIIFALSLIPAPVLAECRNRSQARLDRHKPTNWLSTIFIGAIWLGLIGLSIIFIFKQLGG